MFSTDFIFRRQENLVDNQKCQAGFRPLRNKQGGLLGNKILLSNKPNQCHSFFFQGNQKSKNKCLIV